MQPRKFNPNSMENKQILLLDKILNKFCKDADKFKLPKVLRPDDDCKECYGKGYDGVRTNGKKKEERKVIGYVLCSCIFKKTRKVVGKIKSGEKVDIGITDEKLNWEKKDETI